MPFATLSTTPKGTARTTMSASPTASSLEVVVLTPISVLRVSRLSVPSRSATVTSCPISFAALATADPTLPEPMIATFMSPSWVVSCRCLLLQPKDAVIYFQLELFMGDEYERAIGPRQIQETDEAVQ